MALSTFESVNSMCQHPFSVGLTLVQLVTIQYALLVALTCKVVVHGVHHTLVGEQVMSCTVWREHALVVWTTTMHASLMQSMPVLGIRMIGIV